MRVMQRSHDTLRRIYQPANRDADAQDAPIMEPLRCQRFRQHFINQVQYRLNVWHILEGTASPVEYLALPVSQRHRLARPTPAYLDTDHIPLRGEQFPGCPGRSLKCKVAGIPAECPNCALSLPTG